MMRVFATLVRRELGGFFKSLTGYVVIAAILLMIGFSLVEVVLALNQDPTFVPVTELYYRSFYFWLVVLLTSPVITMRSFAAERSSGTYEALMTTPVGDWQVVLAKFTGAFLFYVMAWLPSLVLLYVLRRISGQAALFVPGVILSTWLGMCLIGAFFVSLGCFTSSLTRSQIVAAMLSVLLGVGLWVVSYQTASAEVRLEEWGKAMMSQVSMIRHMTQFTRGIVDTADVAFYLSSTGVFLFLTHRVVESRRWRS